MSPQVPAPSIADLVVGESTTLRRLAVLACETDSPEPVRQAWRELAARPGWRSHWSILERGLSSTNESERLGAAVVLLSQPAGSNRASVLEEAWQNPIGSASLLEAIGRLGAREFLAEVEKQRDSDSPAVAEAAVDAFRRLGQGRVLPSGLAVERVTAPELSAMLASIPGDPEKGRELFHRLGCVACHTTHRDEPPKGPLLAGISLRYNRNQLVEAVLFPDALIAPGFESQLFELASGAAVEGFVVREIDGVAEVRTLVGDVVPVALSTVRNRVKRDISMMPKGLVNPLRVDEFASLLAYLQSLAP